MIRTLLVLYLWRLQFLVFALGFSSLDIAASSSPHPSPQSSTMAAAASIMERKIASLQDIIGADVGGRGMKDLIVQGDLYRASRVLGRLPPSSTVLILSGFPCCVQHDPPTETDGPPGTMAIARCAVALGHRAVVVVDDCNRAVFQACLDQLALWPPDSNVRHPPPPELQSFPPQLSKDDEARFQELVKKDCDLLISCERAGPARDGHCYTMRGIDMDAAGLIAPLHRFVSESSPPFIAIGDGGNELGMGKVLANIHKSIANAERIACVVPADYLIAAGVSNWGGYALAAGAALCRVEHMLEEQGGDTPMSAEAQKALVADWLAKCLPTAQQETDLLQRAVAAGCRDGVSGKMEATVDGMPLETSLQCLRDIEAACLKE